MRVEYNAPVVLTFSLLAILVHIVSLFFLPTFTVHYFLVKPTMNPFNVLDYFRLVSHVLGHSSWNHLFSNVIFILLLGPILEEKYGSRKMLFMILITALSTGLINVLFLSTGLLGASGIAFMFIVLASIVGRKNHSIPLTFLLVAVIFLGTEVTRAFQVNNISQTAHIVGGICGAAFGFKNR